ncbi:uncharacterized protein N7484_004814 [Penicillium longicatenatum]|uniref:uncharacterized protein n=1 Tax=Penicillium longicatenatum TaxID=1561947 RepID=UPI002547D7D1|nr:uncharacterized protein N7484_004814 [Penicillium longicatenatum]KAJ5651091.1 hypothetical protein N7484_004814 [Penicillium longicatenatum]
MTRGGPCRIGVDVGGTNTDAAIIEISASETESRGVRASSKTPTTVDVTSGIHTVIEDVLSKSSVDRRDILSVAIGTTHFVNAVVEADARRLSRVAVIRLCGPFTKMLPPFSDFPPELKNIMSGPVFYLDGGLEIDGREISPLNTTQIKETVRSIQAAGVDKIALVGIFSPLDAQGLHEETCKQLILEEDPSLSVVCSHTIGEIGLLERENATILNASILSLARRTVHAFCEAMKKLRLDCPLFLTQNDGTLTNAATAAELPIKTFASGPTNSMTGAAYLASLDRGECRTRSETQVLVVDVGGTTSDVCALLPSGFPRQAPNFVEVGGVRTAFSMPEVLCVGLGGGSRVMYDEASDSVQVGPESVGHYLTTQALVFGGEVMTTTDIVVASGKADIGDVKRARAISPALVNKARVQIKKILERAVEDMKVSDLPVTLLLVGGGSIVQMDELEGVAECIIPPHHDSANAVGAAIAKVSGEVDIIEILHGRDEKAVLEDAKQKAIEAAVAHGADRSDTKIVSIDKLPLQYVTNKATRFVVKAVGRLAVSANHSPSTNGASSINGSEIYTNSENGPEPEKHVKKKTSESLRSMVKFSAFMDIESYQPDVQNGIWYISPLDLEFLATGTGVLGTGGGGSSYLEYLRCLESLRNSGKRMRVISPSYMKDSDICVFGSWYGAPSVGNERLAAGTEIMDAIDCSVRIGGHTHFEAVMADEIGGGNGLSTFPSSVHYDIPVVDGDLMGRAYPTMEHGTPYVYGEPITPCAMADARGNTSVVMNAESNSRVETMLRTQCVDLGLSIAISATPLTGKAIKQYAIPNTVSQAWYIGRAIHRARKSKINLVNAIFETTPGYLLYTGKIIDVKRDVQEGYTMGTCTIIPLSNEEQDLDGPVNGHHDDTRCLIVPFQNEFLYAAYADIANPDDVSRHEIICTVPDLISILGQDGEAIGSQDLRYGLRVNVIGMAAHPLWTGDERGLKVGGPEGFGLDMEWKTIGAYQKPPSVIDEFNRQV